MIWRTKYIFVITPTSIIQIHLSRAACRGYSYIYLYMCVCIHLCMCATPPGQTKNDRNRKFGTHTPLDHTYKVTLRTASLEKLPCHVDFPYISKIALFNFFLPFSMSASKLVPELVFRTSAGFIQIFPDCVMIEFYPTVFMKVLHADKRNWSW